MKKHIILLATLFCFIGFGYAQSLEDMGDAAFITGNFKEAESYYIQANKLDPSSVLTDKINKSKTFQTEFDIINRAIESKDYSNANTHINKILLLEPGNLGAIEKRAQLGTRQKAEKKQDFVDNKIPKGFKGWYFNQTPRSGFSVGLGLGLGIVSPSFYQTLKLSYFNYKRYPYTIDYSLHQLPLFYNIRLHGLGMGSAFFLSDKWTIDYGLGVLFSFNEFVPKQFIDPETNEPTLINPETHDAELERYFGVYTRAGITYRCLKGHLGFSYSWTHGFTGQHPIYPIDAHYFMVSGYF